MDQVPVVAESILARVLAHGRDEYAVGESNAGQLNRGEQVR
jgi:hypothetical protein